MHARRGPRSGPLGESSTPASHRPNAPERGQVDEAALVAAIVPKVFAARFARATLSPLPRLPLGALIGLERTPSSIFHHVSRAHWRR